MMDESENRVSKSFHDVASFFERPLMFVQGVRFDVFAAFLNGYDYSVDGALLDGFKPWLIRRLGVCHNRTWDWLVLVAAFDDPVNADLALADESGHKIATDTLRDLLLTFLRERTVTPG